MSDPAERAHALKHGPPATWGWAPRLQRRLGYRSPDLTYEGELLRLVGPDTRWLDVGCGASPSPHNPRLAERLSGICAEFVGVDPGPNLAANPFVHRAVHGPAERFEADRPFDLATMRMVAEHVSDPAAVAAALARLLRPGGTLLLYTIHAWSPTALAGRALPHRAHRWGMRALAGGAVRDVFPAFYRMNTPGRLRRLLEPAGFVLERCQQLDDCRLTQRWRAPHTAELLLWCGVRALGLRYPERCLLLRFRRGLDATGRP